MTSTTAAPGLAIDGGAPVRTAPWPPRHLLGEPERQAALDLFDRCIAEGTTIGYGGAAEEAYCRCFAQLHGGGHADAVNSGSSALYVALLALGLEPFGEVIVPPVTDAGGVMPVPLLNQIPVPADSAPGSLNIGAEQIRQRLTDRTRAIVVAHIAGIPADMDPIMAVANAAGLPVLEDCAQAHGAMYRGRMVGTFGRLAVYSTMFGKHHCTGGQGGVVYCRDEGLYQRCRWAADRGKPFGLPAGARNVIAALNLNQDELSATIGLVQLAKLPDMVARRRRSALALAKGCRDLASVSVVQGPAGAEPSFWFILVRLDTGRLRVDKARFVAALGAEGIPAECDYDHVPTRWPWRVNRAVFGTSGFPWTCPLYRGDPDARHELPNADAAIRDLFLLRFHENCDTREVADTLAALAKVEAAFRR